jgi:transposase
MPIVGGLDIHRKQITFDYLDTVTGQVRRGQISPADRAHLRAWLARFAGLEDVAFAVEGCTGWRYVAEELAAAGVTVHLAEPAGTAFARGRKRHAKTDKTDSRHLRMLLAEGRLPECWIPPGHILETRLHLLRHQLLAAARHLTGAKVLAARLYGVGPITGLAIICWLAGAGRFSSSRKAVRFAGLDITVSSSDRKGPAGKLSRQGPPVLRWALYEAGKTHACTSVPGHRYYATVKDRKNSKRACLSQARKILRQACHILAELGDDARAAA